MGKLGSWSFKDFLGTTVRYLRRLGSPKEGISRGCCEYEKSGCANKYCETWVTSKRTAG